MKQILFILLIATCCLAAEKPDTLYERLAKKSIDSLTYEEAIYCIDYRLNRTHNAMLQTIFQSADKKERVLIH
jgi:hypothetical protein